MGEEREGKEEEEVGRKVCAVEMFYPSWQPLLKMSVLTAISKQFGGGSMIF